jgi:glycosyltransferase involved in cell wall biosynthesis
MKILLVSDFYPPLIGGATRATQLLGRELTRRGHAVTVATIAQRGTPAFERDGDVNVHRLCASTYRLRGLSADQTRVNPAPFPDPELVWRLRRLVRSLRPEIVHAYGWMAHSCAPALLGVDAPLLVSARDYGNVCALRTLYRHDRQCEGPEPMKCLRCAGVEYGRVKAALAVGGVGAGKRLLRRRADGLHSVSTYVEQVMESHFLDFGRVDHEVIPDFREADEPIEGGDDLDVRLPNQPFILYVGALRRVKGVQLLLDAYDRLADPPPLVLIGPGAPDEPADYPKGATAIRGAPYAVVLHAWDRSLFGVAPSLWAEPLGNVVHEGMSRGRAVIGTYPGGHTDMIVHEQTGLLVPAGDRVALIDALRRLIEDEELRRRMGTAALARSEEFTVGQVVPRFEALYSSLVRDRRASTTAAPSR